MTLYDILNKAAEGAYGDDSVLIGKAIGVLVTATFDKGSGPFICGAIGKVGSDGLHEGYCICPSFGSDHQMTTVYMKKDS